MLTKGINAVWEAKHGPHIVFTDVIITKMGLVDTIQQNFDCSFTITQLWMMTRQDREEK